MYADAHSPLAVSPLTIAEQMLNLLYQESPERKLILLGGDHSVSYPAVKAFLNAKKKQGITAAVIHFDAHTDLLKERLGIPVCFGSWVSHVLPLLSSPDLWIQLGIRSSGKTKDHWETTVGLKQFWSNEMQELGPDVLTNTLLEHLHQKKVKELYITFDIDALDWMEAGATGTPERNGLSTEMCVSLIHALGQNFSITAADLTEVAPFVRHSELEANEPKKTLENAVKIIHTFCRAMDPIL